MDRDHIDKEISFKEEEEEDDDDDDDDEEEEEEELDRTIVCWS